MTDSFDATALVIERNALLKERIVVDKSLEKICMALNEIGHAIRTKKRISVVRDEGIVNPAAPQGGQVLPRVELIMGLQNRRLEIDNRLREVSREILQV